MCSQKGRSRPPSRPLMMLVNPPRPRCSHGKPFLASGDLADSSTSGQPAPSSLQTALHCASPHYAAAALPWLQPDYALTGVSTSLLLGNRISTRLVALHIHRLTNKRSTSAQCMPNNRQLVFSGHYFISKISSTETTENSVYSSFRLKTIIPS